MLILPDARNPKDPANHRALLHFGPGPCKANLVASVLDTRFSQAT